MVWQRPSPRVVWKAIHIYLGHAYDGPTTAAMEESMPDDRDPYGLSGLPGHTPSAVRARLETLRSTPDETFYDSPVLERGPTAPKEKDPKALPTKYSLRLGNRSYPHMKLVIDRAPDGQTYLLRADTHDAHIQPKPGSRDYAAFQELSRINHALAEQIETAWEAAGLPTFKKFLREDLERRRAAAEQGQA
jgi:hypothetical protein